MLSALAVAASRPYAPRSLVTAAAWAAWIAAALAFAAAMLHSRHAIRASRALGAMSGLAVLSFCAFTLWVSAAARPEVLALDAADRGALEPHRIDGAAFLRHPELGFAVPDPGQDILPSDAIVDEANEAGGPDWRRAHQVWAWQSDDTQIVLDLNRIPQADRQRLDEAVAEVVDSLGAAGHRGVRRSASGPLASERASALDTTVEARLEDRGHVLARVALVERRGRAYRLTLTVITTQVARWRRWLADVRLDARSPG